MDLCPFQLVPDEPQDKFMERLFFWIMANREAVLEKASRYRDYVPDSEEQDILHYALLAGDRAARVCIRKGEREKYCGYFSRVFRSVLYKATPKKALSTPAASPAITEWLGHEKSVAYRGEGEEVRLEVVDERTPEELMADRDRVRARERAAELLLPLAVESMREGGQGHPGARELWRLLMAGEQRPADALKLTRQWAAKLSNKGLSEAAAFFRREYRRLGGRGAVSPEKFLRLLTGARDPFGVPRPVLSYLARHGAISDPVELSPRDLVFIHRLAGIWGDFTAIASQLEEHGDESRG